MVPHDSSRQDRCHIATCSGKLLCLQAPEASQIDITDIAHGLAYQCCYNGQTSYFYSLAQHSLLVASLVPLQHRLAALLHDASAAYLGDMIRPLCRVLPEYPLLEKRMMAAVAEKFSIADFNAPAIKRAHMVALATEQRDVLPRPDDPFGLKGRSVPIPRRIEFMSPEEARFQFTELFAELVQKTPASKPATPKRVPAVA